MPNINPVLRDITRKDLEVVLSVYLQCEDFLALGPEPVASLAMVSKDIEECRGEGGVFQGIYLHEEMVGVVGHVPAGFDGQPDSAFISLLMIAAPFRGRGIGEEVVRRIENEIRRNPLVANILSAVQVNNPDAVRFWRKNGYNTSGGPELRPDGTTVYRLRKDL